MDVIKEGSSYRIEPVPKRPRRISGTRFASVLGANRWNTPFQIWCEVTGAYRKPFEDTVYTLAGKAIEPKQIDYMRRSYAMDDLVTPEDIWGEDHFSKTYGNFYPDVKVLGGMWDSLLVDDDWDGTNKGLVGHTDAVIEFKTTKRAEDWVDGKIPEYYALQAALYAYLLDCDHVIMVASFLKPKDYEDPDAFVPSAKNTVTREFDVSERYPDFEQDYVVPVLDWWSEHVETGISPEFDEKDDKEYLDALRKVSMDASDDTQALLDEYAALAAEIDKTEARIAPLKAHLETIKSQLKKRCTEELGDEPKVTLDGAGYTFTLSRTSSMKVDTDRMKDDGIFEEYAKPTETIRFTVKKNKED